MQKPGGAVGRRDNMSRPVERNLSDNKKGAEIAKAEASVQGEGNAAMAITEVQEEVVAKT